LKNQSRVSVFSELLSIRRTAKYFVRKCPLPFPYQLTDFEIRLRSEGGNMKDSRDAQRDLVIVLLNEVGGERLDGSGFEMDEPELAFADMELEGEE
jgi:hypothetical protein